MLSGHLYTFLGEMFTEVFCPVLNWIVFVSLTCTNSLLQWGSKQFTMALSKKFNILCIEPILKIINSSPIVEYLG